MSIQLLAEKCQQFLHSGFDENILKEISESIDHVKSTDLNFHITAYQFDAKAPTLQVMPIYFDHEMTITLYVLKGNATIPIHDHPKMFSFLRVLEGKLQIVGYTKIDNRSIDRSDFVDVKPGALRVLGNSEKCFITTPTTDNLHTLRAVGGPAAYLDILVPPFDPAIRNRSHYELVNNPKGLDEFEAEHLSLKKIEPPPMAIRELAYGGPKILFSKVASRGNSTAPKGPVHSGAVENGRVYTVVCPVCSTEIAWKPANAN